MLIQIKKNSLYVIIKSQGLPLSSYLKFIFVLRNYQIHLKILLLYTLIHLGVLHQTSQPKINYLSIFYAAIAPSNKKNELKYVSIFQQWKVALSTFVVHHLQNASPDFRETEMGPLLKNYLSNEKKYFLNCSIHYGMFVNICTLCMHVCIYTIVRVQIKSRTSTCFLSWLKIK